MKEQVAEILGNMAHEVKQCGSKDPTLGLAIKQATLQICQLSQERVDRIFEWIRETDIQIMLSPRKREELQALKKKGVK